MRRLANRRAYVRIPPCHGVAFWQMRGAQGGGGSLYLLPFFGAPIGVQEDHQAWQRPRTC